MCWGIDVQQTEGCGVIPEFVAVWDKHKSELEDSFRARHPEDYHDVVKQVVKLLDRHSDECGHTAPNPDAIQVLNFGCYQGDYLYVVSEWKSSLTDSWYVKVSYGSCSGCDTLESIKSDSEHDEDWNVLPPTESQVSDYMTLALHIIQGFKKLD